MGSTGPALTRPLFIDADFIGTKFDTAAEKAWFANMLCRFIEADFRQTLWTKRLYSRLSMTFGHIAHFNMAGFWNEFFDDLRGKVAFLEQTLAHPCHGQPDHTYCDVERAVQARLRRCGTLTTYRTLQSVATERSERALLAHLSAKYDGTPPSAPAYLPSARLASTTTRRKAKDGTDQPTLI
jgi:hypothetical protein